MIAITSISPAHVNQAHQKNCVQTWINAGYKPVSLNHPDEIAVLQPQFPGVEFVPTHRTHKVLLKKHYVLISAMIDYAKERGEDYNLLINSDIEIYDMGSTTDKLKTMSEEGVIVMHRNDYKEDPNKFNEYSAGLDGFFINKKWLDIYPQSRLCMGQCFWDYWMPFTSLRSNVKTFLLHDAYLFHKEHPVQYSVENWQKFGEIMMHETDMSKRFNHVGKFSDAIYKEINSNWKRV